MSNNKTATKLDLIAKLAYEDKQLKFTSLMHHLNPEYLLSCFDRLKQGKAPGIDYRTKESYSKEEIKQAIEQAVIDLKNRQYRPQPVKRTLIDKPGTTKKRPLGIPTVIDKVIQLAVKDILEAIFEPNFLNCSYGYRPNRGAHQALKAVNHMIMQGKINWIIDADIKGFFDHLDHYWLMESLTQRIKDQRFKSLIWKFLKSGIVQQDQYQPTNQGSPQGGIISPVLANIYLHYVLDLWFEKAAKQQIKGDAKLVRYADDFVIGLQYQDQADKLKQLLKNRLNKFNLELSSEKTRIMEFGRFAARNREIQGKSKPATFDFLGFTHYCSKTRDGRFKLGTMTARKNLNRSLTAMNQWLKTVRNLRKLKDLWPILSSKLQGHYNYYGVSGNFERINWYYHRTRQMTYKWLNRRSHKPSFNWPNFQRYLDAYPLPRPKLTYQIYHTW
jgi:RNA-directed DNA polymerase